MELLCKNIFVFKIMIIENDNYFYKIINKLLYEIINIFYCKNRIIAFLQ